MKRLLIPAVLLLASVAVATCGARDRDNDKETDDRGVLLAIARAPSKIRSWHNPYEGQRDAILAGEKLYRRHCAECHGENARGIGRAVNLHSPGVQNATPGELAWFLRNGNPWKGMPSWGNLPDQRRWQIVAYLKSFETRRGAARESRPASETATSGTNDPHGTESR